MIRQYFLKMPEDFFRQKRIKKLRKLAGGDTYTIIYIKLLMYVAKHDYRLLTENEDWEEIASEINEQPTNVENTIERLLTLGLVLKKDKEIVFKNPMESNAYG